MTVYKLSGGGNDFIALVEPDELPSSPAIRGWCQRGISLGADGLMLLERSTDGARMTHFNSDGLRSSLCLNGCRCAARLAFHLGWAIDQLTLSTDAGELGAITDGEDRVRVDLPPIVGKPRLLTLEPETSHTDLGNSWPTLEGWRLDVGVPHFVLPWPTLADAPVRALGRKLRHHPAMGSAGANINFVRPLGRHDFEIRTYERGVEAETLACGTGAVAAAVSLTGIGNLELPGTAHTAGGVDLVVSQAGGNGCLRLAGDARLVARCDLLPGAQPTFEKRRWRDQA